MKVTLSTEDLIALATEASTKAGETPATGTPTFRPLWDRSGKHVKFLGIEVTFPHTPETPK